MEQTKYIEHLKTCAELTNEIAKILGIRDDAAKQSCFATLIINSDRHGIFTEPLNQNGPTNGSKLQAKNAPEGKSAQTEVKQERSDLPEANKGAIQDPTPEQSDNAKRTELLKGVEQACKLLNKEG